MKIIRARLDSHIRLPIESLSQEASRFLQAALTIDNLAKERLEEWSPYQAGRLPDTLEMFEMDNPNGYPELIIPRGFAWKLFEGLKEFDLTLEFYDCRTSKPVFPLGQVPDLRDYQRDIVERIQNIGQGIIKAPAASGKTVAALSYIQTANQRSLVIVHKKEIMLQWMHRAKQYLGESFPIGFVGDQEFSPNPYLTIAMLQTLWSKLPDLKRSGFFDSFGVVIVDECHHTPAETWKKIISQFSAKTVIGMSATPGKTGDFRIAEIVLGPVIKEINRRELVDSGVLMNPEINVVPTNFKARGRSSSKYRSLENALISDYGRNKLIAQAISKDPHSAQLVISRRKNHLATLRRICIDIGLHPEDLFMLIGEKTAKERDQIIERASEGSIVIFSTLADEALDIPRLDRLHLTFPQSNLDNVRQQIGRIARIHPEKDQPIVYDYWDLNVRVFDRQYMARRHEVYDLDGYKVTKRKRKEFQFGAIAYGSRSNGFS